MEKHLLVGLANLFSWGLTHWQAGMNQLLGAHPSIKQARCVGLFGVLDIQKNRKG